MRTLLIALFLFFCYHCFSQAASCTANYASIDFTNEQYEVDSLKDSLNNKIAVPYYKTPINPDLTDVAYKQLSYYDNQHKIVYIDEACSDTINRCNNDAADLKYYVYYPKGFDFVHCKAPAIILFHGGGFADCSGNFDSEEFQFLCLQFASRGYVTFDVEYRRGRYIDPQLVYFTAQQSLAVYRAMQDARGAIRSIIKHQNRHYQDFRKDPYQIDVNKIFVGGVSAGSVAAVQTVYYPDDKQVEKIFPTPLKEPAIKKVLGSINADYYYGDSTINIWNSIKGCMNLWGQALIPVKYKNNEGQFFKDYHVNMLPMIAFHGKLDSVLPIDTANLVFPPDSNVAPFFYQRLHSVSACLKNNLTYTLAYGTREHPNGLGIGSQKLYKVFTDLGAGIEEYVDCDMMHGINNYLTDNFGIKAKSAYDVYAYIAQRATTFFQAVLVGKQPLLKRNLFFECVNRRVKAATNADLRDKPANCNENCSFENTPMITKLYPQ